ncbi:uncharacterized protein LOC144907127 [Branchiostoma floridae x Branchiostoma belcheri]
MAVFGYLKESRIYFYVLIAVLLMYVGCTFSQKVQVHFHGATVLSWKVAGKDVLFQSREAIYDNQAPIRAGIPIAFPHFGQWEAGPTHGFARTSRWTLEEGPQKDSNGNATAVYSLVDNEETRRLWNHKFKLTYALVFGDTAFKITLKVKNTGESTFNFTTLLHNYFRVDDIRSVTVSGMQGLEYIDKVRINNTFTESRELLTVGEFVDSVYINTPSSHVIKGINGGRTLRMDKENFPDTVVWNPWETMSPNFPDLGNEEYLSFVCVEAGHVVTPVTLMPGEEFTAVQMLTL